jgi:hypothetical protein
LIFPEGNQEFGYKLRPLKKGLARIALEYTKRTRDDVSIIPVGLHFEDYRAFDKRLVVSFGDRFSSLNFSKMYDEVPSLALRRFTEELQKELNSLCISNDDPAQKDAINRYIFSASGYRDANDWRERVAAINSGKYLEDELALQEPQKQRLHWLGTPIALAGLAIFILPYVLLKWLTRLISPDKYFAPSVEFVLFLTIFPWYIFFVSVAFSILTSSVGLGFLFFVAAPLMGKYFLAWRRNITN